MQQGYYSLALTLQDGDYNHDGSHSLSTPSIYRRVLKDHDGFITIGLQDNGKTLAIHWARDRLHYNVPLDRALLPGLEIVNGEGNNSITILGASDSTPSYLVSIQITRSDSPEKEPESSVHFQQFSSLFSGRQPVACHGLQHGGSDSGAPAPALVIAFADGTLLKAEWSEQEGASASTLSTWLVC